MSAKDLNATCGGCGAPLAPSQTKCKFCGKAIVISSFTSVREMSMPELRAMTGDLENGNCAAVSTGGIMAEATESGINFAIASCYLKLKLYDQALEKYQLAIEDNFDNSETYFYAAVALLKGKKAFVTPIARIKQAVEYVQAALSIENRGIYSFFLAYLKYDFFARKFLHVSPDYEEELDTAFEDGVSPYDVEQLFELLNVECPDELWLFEE